MAKHKVEKEYVIVSDANGGAGAGTFWTLAGDVDGEVLKATWLKHNLPSDLVLDTPSEEVAFRRAVKSLEDGALYIESVETTGESALMAKVVDENDLPSAVCLAKWKLNKIGKPEQTFAVDNDMAALHETVVSIFNVELTRIATQDVSGWLKWLVLRVLHGITLRESGGIYYIPPAQLPTWVAIKAAVEEATGHRIYNLPMMKTTDAVLTIMAACIAESESTITMLQQALEENANGNGPKTSRGLDSLANKAADLKAQMSAYEKFLGVTMPQVTDKLEALKAGLFQASALAKSNKDSK